MKKTMKSTSKYLLLWIAGMLLSVQAFAQAIVVNGTVVEKDGEPIIGANVLIKGTTNGAITDLDGNFTLNAQQGDILVISFIGYKKSRASSFCQYENHPT